MRVVVVAALLAVAAAIPIPRRQKAAGGLVDGPDAFEQRPDYISGSAVSITLPNITIGSVHVDDITVTSQGGGVYQISALAWMNITDQSGGVLAFNVVGVAQPNGQAPLYGLQSFSGTQAGSFTPTGGEPVLSSLTIEFNVTDGTALIGGAATFGKLTMRVATDFSKGQGAALGLQCTDSAPSFASLPGAPDAVGNITGISGVAVVISSFEGPFVFPGVQQQLNTEPGVNVFASSKLGSAVILWRGLLQFSSGAFSLALEGDLSNVQFGPGITAEQGKILAQYPASPPLSASVSLVWTSLRSVQLEATFQQGDIHFEGSSTDNWPLPIGGSNPLLMSGIDVTMDILSGGTLNAEAKGTLTWPNVWSDAVDAIMKFPADASHPHCVSLTADIHSATPTLQGMMQAAANDSQTPSTLTPQASPLVSTPLSEVEVAVYPGCGAFYIKGVAETQSGFGTVTAEFAAYKSVDVADTMDSTAGSLPSDPDVSFPLGDTGSATTKASSVLQSVSTALRSHAPGARDAEHMVRAVPDEPSSAVDPLAVIATARKVCDAVPLEPLALVTSDNILVTCSAALDAVEKALTPSAPAVHTPLRTGDDASPWLWAVDITTQNVSWPLDNPPDVTLSVPTFALASGSFAITVGDGMFMAQQGLNFMAQLDIQHSTSSLLDNIKAHASQQCMEQLVQVQGSVNQAGWMFNGDLADGCLDLDGGRIVLSSTSVTLQSADPQVSLATEANFPKAQHGAGLDLQGQATVGADGISLSGQSLSTITTKIGKNPIVITDMNGDASIQWGQSGDISASFSGSFVLVGEAVDVSVSADIASGDFSLTAKIVDEQGIHIGDLVHALLGGDVPAPEDLRDKVYGMKIVEADLDIATQPPTLELGGTVAFWLSEIQENVEAHLGFAGTDLQFSFSISSGNFTPSMVVPQATQFDSLPMDTPGIAMATSSALVPIPGGNYSVNAPAGMCLASKLSLTNAGGVLADVGKLLGVDAVVLAGAIDASAKTFSMQAQVNQDVQIGKAVTLHTAAVSLSVGPSELAISLAADGQVQFSASDILKFNGDIAVSPTGFHLALELPDTWKNPFGLNDVTISDPGLVISFTAAALLTELGIQGAADIHGVAGALDFVADITDPTQSIIAIDVNKTDLGTVVPAVANVPDGTVSSVVSKFSLDAMMLSFNPSTQARTVGNVTFPPGLTIEVDDLTAGPIQASGEFEIDPTHGFLLAGDVQPFALGPYFKLREGQMDIQAMVGQPCELMIDTSMNILGVDVVLNVSIGDSAIATEFDFEQGAVNLHAAVDAQPKGSPWDTTDFAVSATLHMSDWLSNQMPSLANQSKSGMSKQIESWEQKLSGLQDDVDKLQSQIDDQSKKDTGARDAAVQKVKDAEDSVDKAKDSVDGLQSDIDDEKKKLKQCGNLDLKCKAKYGAEIAEHETELKTADTALDAAKKVLKAAEDELAKLPTPDVDPKILAWKAEQATDRTAMQAANATLQQLDKLVSVAQQTISSGAGALKIDKLEFSSSSFNDVAGGSSGTAEVKGQFLGISVDLKVPMAWNAAEEFAQHVWDSASKAKADSL